MCVTEHGFQRLSRDMLLLDVSDMSHAMVAHACYMSCDDLVLFRRIAGHALIRYVFVFNVPSTVYVIWRRGHGLSV